jgi:hypothetical protein
MGILGKLLAGKVVMSAAERARANRAARRTGQFIPANQTESTGLAATANSVLDRAGQFYRENPKKVHALGLIAAAVLLTRMSKGRGGF